MPADSNDKEFVAALARGLEVIEAFDAEHNTLTLSQAATRAGLAPATARRSLHTLKQLGYVRQVGRQFMLSARVLALGSAYMRSAQIEELVVPEIRSIVDTFGDASSVGVLDGSDVLYIAHISRQTAIRPAASMGVRYPAYATSMGRIMLAHGSKAERDRYFATTQPRALTDATVTARAEFERIFEQARRDGFVTTVDQLDYGITALAVPIRNAQNEVVAALNSSGYSGRVSPKNLIADRFGALQQSARRIEENLRKYPSLGHSLVSPRGRASG
jgi:IclR family pca regulon transcriptional regulator